MSKYGEMSDKLTRALEDLGVWDRELSSGEIKVVWSKRGKTLKFVCTNPEAGSMQVTLTWNQARRLMEALDKTLETRRRHKTYEVNETWA